MQRMERADPNGGNLSGLVEKMEVFWGFLDRDQDVLLQSTEMIWTDMILYISPEYNVLSSYPTAILHLFATRNV